MLGMCPVCKLARPIDSDDRMMDHKDPYGTFSCEGVGQDCGVVLKNEPKHKIDRFFDRETGDEDEHSPDSTGSVGLTDEKNYDSLAKDILILKDPQTKAAREKNDSNKAGLFGSIGDQIKFGLQKLSQKERKTRK